MRVALNILLLSLFFWLPLAYAHEMRPAYLEVKQSAPEVYEVIWKIPAKGLDQRLNLYPLFPEGTVNVTESFGRIVEAAYVNKWSIRVQGSLEGKTIYIDGLQNTLTDALVRFERLDGSRLVQRLTPESHSFVVVPAPGKLEVASTYLVLGVEHILLGIDHLLFVLALLMLVKGTRLLIWTITAFTVSHSITLVAASLGMIAVAGPPVEAIIALSILFLASEMIKVHRGEDSLTARRPWLVAFAFGLLHGFGFAGVLGEIGLPQNEIPLALLMFNVGVEVGQLMFVAVALGVFFVVRGALRTLPQWLKQVPAYGVGSIAALWFIERVSSF